MTDLQAIADRVEIEALRGEFTDAAMMRDRARLASLFTPGGVLRMPNIPVELIGQEEIRAGGERLQDQWEFFVQNTHPGTIQLDGDTATGTGVFTAARDVALQTVGGSLRFASATAGEMREKSSTSTCFTVFVPESCIIMCSIPSSTPCGCGLIS